MICIRKYWIEFNLFKLLNLLFANAILIIFSLSIFLMMNVANAKPQADGTFKVSKDVIKYPHKFRFTYDNKFWKDYAIQIVSDNVRLGNYSLRFELRPGDCGHGPGSSYNDCTVAVPSERHELIPQNMDKDIGYTGTTWHTISFYLEEFDTSKYKHNSIFQFHGDGDGAPQFNWSLEDLGLQMQRRTACNLKEFKKLWKQGKCGYDTEGNKGEIVLPKEELFNKWHDVVMNVKWSLKENTGFLKMWINGNLVYHYTGSTAIKRANSAFQFGVYRAITDRSDVNQVAFFDEIRYAKKKCKKLKLEDLGYFCEELENQKITKIDYISGKKKFDTEIASLSKEERYIKTLTTRITKKIVNANSLSEDKGKKVTAWVNKELKKWAKKEPDELDTIEGRKKKIQSLTKKGIKKFQ